MAADAYWVIRAQRCRLDTKSVHRLLQRSGGGNTQTRSRAEIRDVILRHNTQPHLCWPLASAHLKMRPDLDQEDRSQEDHSKEVQDEEEQVGTMLCVTVIGCRKIFLHLHKYFLHRDVSSYLTIYPPRYVDI